MKRMLFNATQPEELRVAIVDGPRLVDLDLESAVRTERKGNIYKAVVTRVEPSLEAAFVDFGAERQGFLPLKEIYRGYFSRYDSTVPISDVRIANEIHKGQEMLVQVEKEERGAKGAALTTFISLAGRFLVLMPNNPKGGGISRRISGDDRNGLRDVLAHLNVDPKHALIARTAGIGRDPQELQQDLNFLMKLWDTIETTAAGLKPPQLIHQESNLIVRSLRDHLSSDITEIVVDDAEIYERARRFIQQVMPQNLSKLKRYEDSTPLFSRFQIERQIESAFHRKVTLPSGGAIVIDHTEALTSIDVNSGRATRGADIEVTALQTNLEASDEVARQLRIRDLGGLVVIDLIDMADTDNQRTVENRFRDALRPDRARVQVGKISRFGLLEMSRQRLRASLGDTNYDSCPRCEGSGTIRNVVSASLHLLRLIEDKALQENSEAIQVAVPLDMATYLLNEKRRDVSQLESRLASRIIIVPSTELTSPQHHLRRLRKEELDELSGLPSYRQPLELEQPTEDLTASMKSPPVEVPQLNPDQLEQSTAAAPPRAQPPAKPQAARTPKQPGLFRRPWNALIRLWNTLTGDRPATPQATRGRSAEGRGRRPPQRDRSGAPRRGRPPSNRGADSGGRGSGRAPQNPGQGRRSGGDPRRGRGGGAGPRPPRQGGAQPTHRSGPPQGGNQPPPPPRSGQRQSTRRDFASQDPQQGGTQYPPQASPRSAPPQHGNPPPPPPPRGAPQQSTRRDFASQDPQQRVGQRTRPAQQPPSRQWSTPNQAPRHTQHSSDPNRQPPPLPRLPEDFGNR